MILTHPSKTYWTFTFKNSAELMDEIVAIYMEEVEKVKDAPGIVPSAVFQPITTGITKHFAKNGGNALGLDGQGPLTRKQRPLVPRFLFLTCHSCQH